MSPVIPPIIVALTLVCSASRPPESGGGNGETNVAFKISSNAFKDGQPIPRQYTCQGKDVSPPLSWEGAPEGTIAYALIVDDPDAPVGTWVHWVLFNIPGQSKGLAEGIAAQASLPDGSIQGLNDFRRIGYGGPCPPPGSPHRYFFKLYALDEKLSLPPKSNKAQLLDAIKGHVTAETSLVGLYRR